MTTTSRSPLLLTAPSSSSLQFILSTLPVLAILIYFLISVALMTSHEDHEQDDGTQQAATTAYIFNTMYAFLGVYSIWCLFGIHLFVFTPKRRDLIGRYLRQGSTTMGSVMVEGDDSGCCGTQDYGQVVYAHPYRSSGVMIRKRVRFFQKYTARESVPILILHDRPKSGQPRTDLELDLQASDEGALARVCACWLAFAGLSHIFLISKLQDRVEFAWVMYLSLALVVAPLLAYLINLSRWILYVRWMTDRGEEFEQTENGGGQGPSDPTDDGTELRAFHFDQDGTGTLQDVEKGNTIPNKNRGFGAVEIGEKEHRLGTVEMEFDEKEHRFNAVIH